MPVYSWACDDCKIIEDRMGTFEMCGSSASCSICFEPMRRLFSFAVLNRKKSGVFRHDPCKLDAWDDRLAHLKAVENTDGPNGMRRVRAEVGEQLWHETLQHKRERYG